MAEFDEELEALLMGEPEAPLPPHETICEECGPGDPAEAEHDFAVRIPSNPWDEVTPGLWIGGSVVPGDLTAFDAVVSLSRSGAWATPVPPTVEHVRHFFGDAPVIPPAVALAVADTVDMLAEGMTVLVRCQAGLNRSGMVVALTLVELGWTPDEAIALVREKRSPSALFNPVFVAHVTGEVHECEACDTGGHLCAVCAREIVHGLVTCRACAGKAAAPLT